MSSGGVAVRLSCRKAQTCRPFIYQLLVEIHLIPRDAIALVEVLGINFIPSSSTLKLHLCAARRQRFVANHCPATGSGFPRSYIERFVARERQRLSFDSTGMMSDSVHIVSDTRYPMKPVVDSIAPNYRMPCLVLQLLQHIGVAFIINLSAKQIPIVGELRCLFSAVVMRIVDRLDHGLP